MKKKVVNLMNKEVSEVELPESVFGIKVFPDILHQYIRYQNAKSRQGTHKTKTRSEVNGRAKKPFSQKGTGNARQGSSKPPNFRGGAISMGPQNRDHSFSLNKKEKKLALKCALSEKPFSKAILVIRLFVFVNSHLQCKSLIFLHTLLGVLFTIFLKFLDKERSVVFNELDRLLILIFKLKLCSIAKIAFSTKLLPHDLKILNSCVSTLSKGLLYGIIIELAPLIARCCPQCLVII